MPTCPATCRLVGFVGFVGVFLLGCGGWDALGRAYRAGCVSHPLRAHLPSDVQAGGRVSPGLRQLGVHWKGMRSIPQAPALFAANCPAISMLHTVSVQRLQTKTSPLLIIIVFCSSKLQAKIFEPTPPGARKVGTASPPCPATLPAASLCPALGWAACAVAAAAGAARTALLCAPQSRLPLGRPATPPACLPASVLWQVVIATNIAETSLTIDGIKVRPQLDLALGGLALALHGPAMVSHGLACLTSPSLHHSGGPHLC